MSSDIVAESFQFGRKGAVQWSVRLHNGDGRKAGEALTAELAPVETGKQQKRAEKHSAELDGSMKPIVTCTRPIRTKAYAQSMSKAVECTAGDRHESLSLGPT